MGGKSRFVTMFARRRLFVEIGHFRTALPQLRHLIAAHARDRDRPSLLGFHA